MNASVLCSKEKEVKIGAHFHRYDFHGSFSSVLITYYTAKSSHNIQFKIHVCR